MYESIAEIEALLGQEAESISLDFKSGLTFNQFSDKERSELIKDVTAFANAAGGTIIIGVSEDKSGSSNIASSIEPVTNPKISVDQLTLTIKSNTEPSFSAFRIVELTVESGRVFVIQIEQADTAHQNRRDFKYYQRTGTISEPMYDFAIRDVMNRRTHPRLKLDFEFQVVRRSLDSQECIYRVVPRILNVGSVTARHWALSVDLPASVAKIGTIYPGMPMRHKGNVNRRGVQYSRVELHSGPTTNNPVGTMLLPGQERLLGLESSFAEMDLDVSHEKRVLLERSKAALHWSLFLDDAPREDGEIPFSEWCTD
jgi:hypothetical protein